MTTPPTLDRAALRSDLRARRRALPAGERIAGAEQLAARMSALPPVPDGAHVAGYWAMDGEIALHAWQLRLPRSVTYCLPILHDDGRLRFAPWRPGEPLAPNRYGIPEPVVPPGVELDGAAMSLVVLPLVGFDARGHRLGMGAGWYDRTFAFRLARPAPPRLVGVAFAVQQVEALPTEPWDVPLDAVCTERDTFLFEATEILDA